MQKLLTKPFKTIVKKKATFPVKKMASKTEVNKTNSTKNGNTHGHFLEKKKATLPQQRYQKMVTKTLQAMAMAISEVNKTNLVCIGCLYQRGSTYRVMDSLNRKYDGVAPPFFPNFQMFLLRKNLN